jgi:signal transduction histidine kinase
MEQQANTKQEPAGRRPRSLKGRLVGSHILVILLALGLVVASSALLLRRYERGAEIERLTQLAVPLVAEVNITGASRPGGAGRPRAPIDALDAQAAAMNLRLIVMDQHATVHYDTSETANLEDQQLPQFATRVTAVVARAKLSSALQFEIVTPDQGDELHGQLVLIAAGRTGRWNAERALLIVSDVDRQPLIRLYLPRLFLVTGLSLIAASAVGLALSRWISLPIERLTRAADAMAAGDLEQEVAGAGDDEIGHLVARFNLMSRKVATTHRGQRNLLADVAHELRTPLTSVQGYARALRDKVIDDEAGRATALATIDREAGRMETLIAQLLDLARLESGHAPLDLQPVPLERLFARTEERFRTEATGQGVVLTLNAPSGLAVRGDETRLLQVLSNLLSNAVRHTPAGGLVAVSAAPIPMAQGGGGVRLTVHDTGEGIDPALAPRVFDRFSRGAHGSTGTGLGLAVVREIVEQHHGAIAVTSELGRGSTFSIDLPRA